MESSRVVSNQIYYKQSNEIAPRYKYVKINMSNIMSNSVTVSNTSSTQVQFKLPYNTVYNLSKSKLSVLIPVPAQTSGGNKVSYTTVDAFPFGNQTVSLETGNGLQLLNLSEAARYTKVVTKVNKPFKQFMTTDDMNIPHPYLGDTVANNKNANNVNGSYLYEPEYFTQSATGTAVNIPFYYELSNFVHSILSLDKDLYFGSQELYIKMTIDNVSKWCFSGSAANDPVTAATALANPIVSLQNVYLWLAVEMQPEIIENIVTAYSSRGLRILIDYPVVTRIQTAASTNQAIVIPFVPAMGKTLKRLYHSVFNSADNTNLTLDCENTTTNPKITSYNTYLDSTKLQDDIITSASAMTATAINADDWRLNQPFCEDSVLFNYAVYQKNWVHIDDFSSAKSNTVGGVSPDNLKSGLPMERGIQYQFIATSSNAGYIHDNFAIFTREVEISPNGIQFV